MKVLIKKEDLKRRIKELAKQISEDYRGKTPVFIAILKGAFIFLSDLIRELEIDCIVDFMAVTSYNGSTESSGAVEFLKDVTMDIQGKDVIIVEDIVDTGLTLDYIKKVLELRKPASLKICVLLDKKKKRRVKIEPDYVGFEIGDVFVVGYGLDFGEKYRNLPEIYCYEER